MPERCGGLAREAQLQVGFGGEFWLDSEGRKGKNCRRIGYMVRHGCMVFPKKTEGEREYC